MFPRCLRPISCLHRNVSSAVKLSNQSIDGKFISSNRHNVPDKYASSFYLRQSSHFSLDSKVTIKQSEDRGKPATERRDDVNTPDRLQPPNHDELELIKDHMIQYIPFFFTMTHQYKIYRKDVIFENNTLDPPKTIIGIAKYAIEVAKLRMYAHCKYANVKASVVSADVCPINGSVRVHWKVAGISQKSAFMFWNFLPWNYRNAMNDQSLSTEGVSTFYVNGGDGLIIKHRLDNVILDEDSADKNKIREKADKLGFT